MAHSISITLPTGWHELTETQLRYVYYLFAKDYTIQQVKTYCLIRWSGLQVKRKAAKVYILKYGKEKFNISSELLADAIHSLDWLEDIPTTPIRLPKIGNFSAVDALFQEVAFEKFLYCDNLYQGYIYTRQSALLAQMAELLYNHKVKLSGVEQISIFYWWLSLKDYFSRMFPHFLQPSQENEDNMLESGSLSTKLRDAMNTQIRALTKGDVTKEKDILQLDTWRALTELDALAKEYDELNSKYK